MFRVREGKVVEAWNSFDFLKMFQADGGQVKNIASGPLISALLPSNHKRREYLFCTNAHSFM